MVTPRFKVMYIVTEYDAADLYLKSIPARKKALIAVVHPYFRNELNR